MMEKPGLPAAFRRLLMSMEPHPVTGRIRR